MNDLKEYLLKLLKEDRNFKLSEADIDPILLNKDVDALEDKSIPDKLRAELELNKRAVALLNNVIRTDESIDPEDPEKST